MLLSLTLARSSGYIVSTVFGAIGLPKGYYSALIMVMALPFIYIILLSAKKSIVKPFWLVSKYWLPWIVYLFIAGLPTAEGVWKLQMYIGIVLLPAMLIVLMALADPVVFQKYFMKVLLFLNIIILAIIYFNIVKVNVIEGAEGIERLIWLSRGIGLSIAYILITSAWRKHIVLNAALVVVLFSIMIYIGSRGPVISLLLTIGFFFAVKNRKNITTIILSTLTTIILIIAFLNVGYLTDFTRSFAIHGKTAAARGQTVAIHRNTSKITHFADDRLSAYTPTLRIFGDHPLVGVGLGQWWKSYQKENRLPDWLKAKTIEKKMRGQMDVQYPHNIFLEILAELGIIGMVCFLLLFLPFRRIFSLSNEYNVLCLLGLLYACSSSDITQNSAPMIFNLLSILRARGLLPSSDEDTDITRQAAS